MTVDFDDILANQADADLAALDGFSFSLTLFVLAAAQGNFALPYSRQQFRSMQAAQSSTLGPLARCCLLIAKKNAQGSSTHQTLTRLAQRPAYTDCAELISRALLHQQDPQAWPPPQSTNPLPAKLLRALLHWPDKPGLLERVLHILAHQPALSSTLCQQATAYTPQGKQLGLKQSLLLLGPQRSRELLLLSHFESSLTQPYFPLRSALLQRRRLINQVLLQLQSDIDLELPCRIELLTYLLIYDAWRNPAWCVATRWKTMPEAPVFSLARWLPSARPLQGRTAGRLVQYWQLHPHIQSLISSSSASSPAAAALQLAVAATDPAPQAHLDALQPALQQCKLSPADYDQLIEQAKYQVHDHCPWPERRY
ncbi:hypothetical protein ACR0ST_06485 [Aliidiomarina sp. Khilg15.8]